MAEAKTGTAKKRKLVKGRHRSAIKRQRQSVKREAKNRGVHSNLRTAVKKVQQAVTQKNKELADQTLRLAASLLHKAGNKGIIHHRNAARHVARLASLVSAIG